MGYEVPDYMHGWFQEGVEAEQLASFARQRREEQLERPSYILRPRVYRDGDSWCALLGDDLQMGVCGFGDSPEEAYADFDKSWTKKMGAAAALKSAKTEEAGASAKDPASDETENNER